MDKSTSQSQLSILDGTGSESNSDENSDTESNIEDYCCSMNQSALVDEDVVATYILKPREILKNIDLMRTVAILMEGKLRQTPPKCPDHEKIRDLYSDIHRFPEAFLKFTSIVHQIQYLNITADWEQSTDIPNVLTTNVEIGNIFTKAFRNSFSKRNTPQDVRKGVMMDLLKDTQKVFKRYQAIQKLLEDRLKKYNKLILKILPHNGSESVAGIETEDDDPQRPLLSNPQTNPPSNFNGLIRKSEMMSDTLKKTRRSAIDVQDSIDVLRDLIRWDYKQATATPSVSVSQSYLDDTPEISYQQSWHDSDCFLQSHENTATTHTAILMPADDNRSCCRRSQTPDINTRYSSKLLIILAIIITAILVLSIITAALSFLKFSY